MIDIDDIFRKILRILEMEEDSYYSSGNFRQRSIFDNGDVYITDDNISITIDLGDIAREEDIYINLLDNETLSLKILDKHKTLIPLPKKVIVDSLKYTFINGILDINMEVDKKYVSEEYTEKI